MEKRIVAANRKARHQYHILETYEAGLALLGTEVKALREARVNLSDGYARFRDRELYLVSVHIGAYSHAGDESHDNLRERKLLLSRRELNKLRKAAVIKGADPHPPVDLLPGGVGQGGSGRLPPELPGVQ